MLFYRTLSRVYKARFTFKSRNFEQFHRVCVDVVSVFTRVITPYGYTVARLSENRNTFVLQQFIRRGKIISTPLYIYEIKRAIKSERYELLLLL